MVGCQRHRRFRKRHKCADDLSTFVKVAPTEPCLLTKIDIHFWKTATLWRQEANLWRGVASDNLRSSFNVGGWRIFFSPVPRQTKTSSIGGTMTTTTRPPTSTKSSCVRPACGCTLSTETPEKFGTRPRQALGEEPGASDDGPCDRGVRVESAISLARIPKKSASNHKT
jgi:hypothetical protein